MLRQLVVARLEACNHFRVDLVAALARKLEVPGVALLFDLVELHQVRIVAALGARVVRDMGVLDREDRIIERAVPQIVHLEFLLRLGNLAILRVDGTAVEDKDEVHHLLGLDRFAEVHQLLHAELLGFAKLAVKHLFLVFREFHGHVVMVILFRRIAFPISLAALGSQIRIRPCPWLRRFNSGLHLARDRDRGLLPYLRRVDLHPVAGLDGSDRVLVQAVDGGDSTGNGSADVDIVDFLADDGRRAVMRLRTLVVQADGAGGGAHHRGIDHDLANDAFALEVGPGHQDDAVLVADVVERPPHPLAVHRCFAGGLSFRTGRCRSTRSSVP